MKKLAIGLLLLAATASHAAEPRIVETDQGVLVEYDGVPSPLQSAETRVKTLLDRQREEIIREAAEAKERISKEMTSTAVTVKEEVRIISLLAIQLRLLGDSPDYSIKVDIENAGVSGYIALDIVALDANGFQLDYTPLSGPFRANEVRTLTTQKIIDRQSGKVARWEARLRFKKPMPVQ